MTPVRELFEALVDEMTIRLHAIKCKSAHRCVYAACKRQARKEITARFSHLLKTKRRKGRG